MHKAAIVYDFDGTLAPGNMQEHGFITFVGSTKEEFWPKTKEFARLHDADEVLTYMRLMLQAAAVKGHPITRQSLNELGARIPLFAGVSDWFAS